MCVPGSKFSSLWRAMAGRPGPGSVNVRPCAMAHSSSWPRQPLVCVSRWRSVGPLALSCGSSGRYFCTGSSTSSRPSSASSSTAMAVKCLLVEAMRMRVVGVSATPISRLAMPTARRYSRRPSWAMASTRPGASLRFRGATSASMAASAEAVSGREAEGCGCDMEEQRTMKGGAESRRSRLSSASPRASGERTGLRRRAAPWRPGCRRPAWSRRWTPPARWAST
ncbi:hypothetical protein FQZ97_624580 [compost metagenome]